MLLALEKLNQRLSSISQVMYDQNKLLASQEDIEVEEESNEQEVEEDESE